MFKQITFVCLSVFMLYACNFKKEESASEEKEIQVEKEIQTYAELSVKENGEWKEHTYKGGTFKNVDEFKVPDQHTDHSGFIRYEGPGWENSQVGYRLYLDWRNAIDIFGKKVDTMVLANVGHPSSGSYHEEADWGMDILKAGKSMGLGGFGRYMNDSVVHFREVDSTLVKINNSESFSEVKIQYSGWTTGDQTIDLAAVLSVYPEDRFTKVELTPSEKITGLSTGIVKSKSIPVIQKETENWAYIATYGKQTLAGDDDKLGMAVFYKTSKVEQTLEGPHDHLVVFKPDENLTYYFLAAWEQEKNGLSSKEEFINDINMKLQTLDETGQL